VWAPKRCFFGCFLSRWHPHVSGSRDNTVRVWDASSGTEVFRAIWGTKIGVVGCILSRWHPHCVWFAGQYHNASGMLRQESRWSPKCAAINAVFVSCHFPPDGALVGLAREIILSVSGRHFIYRQGPEYKGSNLNPSDEPLSTILALSPRMSYQVPRYTAMSCPKMGFPVAFSPDGSHIVSSSSGNTNTCLGCPSGAKTVTQCTTPRFVLLVMFTTDALVLLLAHLMGRTLLGCRICISFRM